MFFLIALFSPFFCFLNLSFSELFLAYNIYWYLAWLQEDDSLLPTQWIGVRSSVPWPLGGRTKLGTYVSLSPSLFIYCKYHWQNIDGFPPFLNVVLLFGILQYFCVTHSWYLETPQQGSCFTKIMHRVQGLFSAIFLRVKDQRIFESKWARWKLNI